MTNKVTTQPNNEKEAVGFDEPVKPRLEFEYNAVSTNRTFPANDRLPKILQLEDQPNNQVEPKWKLSKPPPNWKQRTIQTPTELAQEKETFKF